ncbi:hypothetical protein ACNKF0_08890 [Nocardioides sp. T5]|uniref:hypothetical protein n=1 Tax=Nocardioides sp. T5 TaxID=3400182 RepID=UPI003A86FA01
MNQAVPRTLSEPELSLVRESEPAALRDLTEDELLDLHTRVRRARSKHLKVYRRGAALTVGQTGGRGSAYARNQKARDKAEVFESLLARVSRQVAVAARRSSDELRRERLADARADRSAGPAVDPAGSGPAEVPSTKVRRVRTSGGVKKDASSRSMGARRQAARDAR